jgi:hypothetical protein
LPTKKTIRDNDYNTLPVDCDRRKQIIAIGGSRPGERGREE